MVSLENSGSSCLGRLTLTVCEPIDGIPTEDSTGGETPTQLVDEGIVKRHPLRSALAQLRRLDAIPEVSRMQALPRRPGVQRPPALHGQDPCAEGLAEDGAGSWALLVDLAPAPHDQRAQAEQTGGQEEGEVEANVLLCIHHGKLTDQASDVDEEVEPVVDTADGDGRIDNDTLSRFESDDLHVLGGYLFDDQGVDVWLEATSTEADDQDGDDQTS